MRIVPATPRLALWLVVATGCGPTPENASDASPEASALEAGGGVDSTADRTPAVPSPSDAPLAADADWPTPFPDLDEETVLRTYELWIVNRMRTDLFIYASAGAGRVTLDTVPGRDSVKVNVQVRARSLSLDAEDRAGRSIDSTRLELAPAASNRWEIAEPGGAR